MSQTYSSYIYIFGYNMKTGLQMHSCNPCYPSYHAISTMLPLLNKVQQKKLCFKQVKN